MKKYKSVLLVDDDAISNFIHYACLEKLKIADHIQIERNGEEALKFLRKYFEENKCLPELIFVDIVMPVMDGYEFLEAFEKFAHKSPVKPVVVIVSTLLSAKDLEYLNRKGYFLYLDKPIDKAKLLKILKKSSQLLAASGTHQIKNIS